MTKKKSANIRLKTDKTPRRRKRVDVRSLLSPAAKNGQRCPYCRSKVLRSTVQEALQLMAEEPQYWIRMGTLHRKLQEVFPNISPPRADTLRRHIREHETELKKLAYPSR